MTKAISNLEILDTIAKAKRLQSGYRFDWFEVIMDVQRSGMTFDDMEAATRIPKNRIKGWKLHRYSLKTEDALPIIRLWMQQTGKKIGQLPIELKIGSAAS
jgi:hypothetical protein